MTDTQTPRLRLALFDLDHTLLPLDSDYEWGEFTIRLGWNDPVEFARRNDEFYAHYQAGTLDVHDYVRFATEAVRLRGPEAAAAAHAQFMREVIAPAIRPQALDLIRQHQAAGEQVLIVTATNEFVTRPIAKALGVEELLAVQLARDAQGGTRVKLMAYRPCARARCCAWNNGWPTANWAGGMWKARSTAIP